MLYVFQVDTGSMMTFEMRLAMDYVGNLKKAIAAKIDVPEDKQVLLISGGESLNSQQKVCSYSSAGTETSPIFLFAKINIESNQTPMLDVDFGDDANMTEMIESCMSMQPSLDTLVARTELAADLNQQAINQKEVCERLVHDQHLQQQGWAAVTANLEDLTRAFKNKAEVLMLAFGEFIKCKPKHRELLEKFGDDVRQLENITILPTLVENNKLINLATSKSPVPTAAAETSSAAKTTTNITASSSSSSSTTTTATSPSKTNEEVAPTTTSTTTTTIPPSTTTTQLTASDDSSITLRQWIDYHDNQNSLERLIDLCWRGLERFTEKNAEQILNDVQELVKQANDNDIIEIKKLEERLFGLEKLMVEAKKVVDEQGQLASSFQNNRERFSKIKDSTLLPDLSASHKQQLQMMLTNHKRMVDYRNRCVKAKQQLSFNLHVRLRTIMYIEQQISDLDGKLMIYRENLIRLQRHFDIVDQIHRAPTLYLESVVEALRRRRFSRRYLHWANSIAKISQDLYENEMTTRKAFDTKLGSHFLTNLFPGLKGSYPPPFATVQPDPFDTKLPRVTPADIQYLQANLSEDLAKILHIPKDIPMPHVTTASNIDDSVNHPDVDIGDEDERHSLNPTPPSSPLSSRQQREGEGGGGEGTSNI